MTNYTAQVARENVSAIGEHRRRMALIDAEVRGSMWLANGNEAAERGNKKRAEVCYRKAQFWLDKYNRLAGNGDGRNP